MTSADIATPGSIARFRLRVNMMLGDGAAEGRWLMWDQAALASWIGIERWFDPVAYHSAKVPFNVELCPLAADNIASLLAAKSGKSSRALVLDLDNTLWAASLATTVLLVSGSARIRQRERLSSRFKISSWGFENAE
jgi:predicted enzyme involved in methoxymalonyl-ACP biosynthesis